MFATMCLLPKYMVYYNGMREPKLTTHLLVYPVVIYCHEGERETIESHTKMGLGKIATKRFSCY